jgi:DNA-binding NtrC family response regulator
MEENGANSQWTRVVMVAADIPELLKDSSSATLPTCVTDVVSLKESTRVFQQRYIERVLALVRYRKTAAARLLKISRVTLNNHRKRFEKNGSFV